MEGDLAGAARRHDRRRHPPRAVRAAAGDSDVGGAAAVGDRAARHRRPLPRRPRAEHDAVGGDRGLARGVRHAGGAGHRKRAPLRRVGREGAHRSRPAHRRRDPARAAAGADLREPAPSISPPRRFRAGRSAATSSTTWRSASAGSGSRSATWPARGRRRRCWRPPCRATSSRRRRSAPTRRRRWRASTRRCCGGRSRRASRRCSTAR